MSAGDGTLKVRAVCPAGHETLTTAPKGRVTWRGPCHTDGCDHRIVARKVLEAPAAPAKTAEPTEPPKPVKKIRKVAAYRAKPAGQADPAAPGFGTDPAPGRGAADGGDAGVPDPAGGGPAGGPPAVPAEQPGRRIRERVAAARQRRAERRLAELDDDRPWTIPGIYR